MIPNPYREDRKKAPGEQEVERADLLLVAFRYLGVPMPAGKKDEEAVQRAGILLWRWLRNKHPMLSRIIDRRLK